MMAETCLAGIKQKCIQNPLLMNMLKSTKPKTRVEAQMTNSGEQVYCLDFDALKEDKWYGKGWLSEMLHSIRDT